VINTGTNLVTTTVAVGLAPAGLAISPDNTRVYVVNNRGNTISVIDVAADSIIGTVNAGSGPESIAIINSLDGMRAYVTNAGSATVTELGGPVTLTIAKTGNGIGTGKESCVKQPGATPRRGGGCKKYSVQTPLGTPV
jgi:YVTN family beta-propeller protein